MEKHHSLVTVVSSTPAVYSLTKQTATKQLDCCLLSGVLCRCSLSTHRRNITLRVSLTRPSGTGHTPRLTRKGALTECYDELGNRYQLPVYCLSPPVNMIEECSDEPDGSDPDSGAADPSTGSAGDPTSGGERQLRLRLSTGRDLRLAVRCTDTVGMMKRRLQSQEAVPAATQRWFFSGRPLTDRLRLDQLNISRDYVVQVILSQPPPPEPVTTAGHLQEATGPVAVEAVTTLPQEPTPVEN